MNTNGNRLENFPVSFFAMVMGMAGITIAWQKCASLLHFGSSVYAFLAPFTLTIFAVLSLLYGWKLLRYRPAVSREIHNPVKLNFFPAFSISLLLIAIFLLPVNAAVAHGFWITGVAFHFVFTLYVMKVWIHHEGLEVHHINPAWFIPVVGNVLVPIAGTRLGYSEISWFFFSIGIVFWLVLFTIIFYRVLFHQPLPDKLMPTFFILIAPPAVGFLSYVSLAGELDAFARVLYFLALFLTILLLTQYRYFLRLKFFLSWWAYSFPLAAVTISTMKMYELTGKNGFYYLGETMLALLSIVILMLLYKTFRAIGSHRICVEEG
jgi:tellurite resistance protein